MGARRLVYSPRGRVVFRIKVCGITNVEDACEAAAAGAEAIGLNFYAQSKRYVAPALARRIAAAAPPEVVVVGVFVNAPIEGIREVVEVDDVRLDLIQLHGDEPPEFVVELTRRLSLPVMRAFAFGRDGPRSVGRYVGQCSRNGCPPRMILVDADCPGSYGGTGKTADWAAVGDMPREGLPPLILAGGLTPENVGEAIARARPAGVDVAGGVESSPGRKDAGLVRAFIEAARGALEGERKKDEGSNT